MSDYDVEMLSLDNLIADSLTDFVEVARLANAEFPIDKVHVQVMTKPHRPPSQLPSGKMAVYAFFWSDRVLKVGKVGPKSSARYCSQHYNPESAQSNLAQSILTNQAALGFPPIDPNSAGEWIKTNPDRVNLVLPVELGLPLLALLESFLHVRWKPAFEGKTGVE